MLAHELAHVKQQTGAAISMMPQEDADLEIDPDPRLEREADEAAKDALSGEEPLVVNRMGTDVHVQRMPEAERLEQARQEAADSAAPDLESLATRVENLSERVSEVEQAGGEQETPLTERLGLAAGKGAIGVAGGLVGAAAGTLIAPGVGTASGAVAGQQVVTELASAVASDVSKAAYEPVFEAGTDVIPQQSSDFSAYIENLIDEKLRQRFGGAEYEESDKTDF